MLEKEVEKLLKDRLEAFGFLTYKLQTPGKMGVPDRLIIRPLYSPGPPMFLELKKAGKTVRPLQKAMADQWKARGVTVLPPAAGIAQVHALIDRLIKEVYIDYCFATEQQVFPPQDVMELQDAQDKHSVP